MRNYSLTVNPFVDGLKHRGYNLSKNTCGLELEDFAKTSYNSIESGAYWLGRCVRFVVSCLATIPFLFLQAVAALAATVELLTVKAVCLITRSEYTHSSTYKFIDKYSLSFPLHVLSKKLIFDAYYFAMDVHLIEEDQEDHNEVDLADRYATYIKGKLFPETE